MTPLRNISRGSDFGGALLIALMLATSVAVLAVSVLQVSAYFTRRQVRTQHNTRAFYVAEAALAEAYHSMTAGGTGQVGSREQPAA